MAGKCTNHTSGAFARGRHRLGNVHAKGEGSDRATPRRRVSMGSGAIRSDQMARVLEHCRKIGRLVWVGIGGLSENGTHPA